MIVTRMRLEDITGCLSVIAEAWDPKTAQGAHNDLRAMFASPKDAPTFYVIHAFNAVVGVAGHVVSWKNDGLLDLIYVAVRPGVRRQGIGSKLVERCLQDADALDCAVMLTTNVPGFYQDFGFVSLDDDLVCAGESNVLMRRRCRSQRERTPATLHPVDRAEVAKWRDDALEKAAEIVRRWYPFAEGAVRDILALRSSQSTALLPAASRPDEQGEPVAWAWEFQDRCSEAWVAAVSLAAPEPASVRRRNIRPLYAHPAPAASRPAVED